MWGEHCPKLFGDEILPPASFLSEMLASEIYTEVLVEDGKERGSHLLKSQHPQAGSRRGAITRDPI